LIKQTNTASILTTLINNNKNFSQVENKYHSILQISRLLFAMMIDAITLLQGFAEVTNNNIKDI